ncbi:MAG: hypothetical protein IH593_11835 [Bacteroidales bacterium]|nr:hypothetical protein [Bacteroidales bacterium]
MHVALSSVEKLTDYCLNSLPDRFRSAASVEQLNELITLNLEYLKKR